MISLSDDYTYVDKIEIKEYEPNDGYGRWHHGITYCALNISIGKKTHYYDTFIRCPFKTHNIDEIQYKTHGLHYGNEPITLAIRVEENTYGLLTALAGKKELKQNYILLDNVMRMPITKTSLQGLLLPFSYISKPDTKPKIVIIYNYKYLDRIGELL